MKKSLSTILSLAMAFSMFSSVAMAADAAKTSADFSDLKDLDAATKAKFDALISAGVFDGVSEGTFGLKDEMNRAQFAKVAALIFNLKVDTSLKVSTFSDVKADDPANGYALPYIEAVKAAGITDGYAPGEFNPAGAVTKEQLAAFLIRGIKKDAEAKATPGVNDSTVSDWAKGYVALALNLKLLSNNANGTFGGTSNATRDLLVLGAYEGKQQYRSAAFDGQYAIASLKATDANKLALELNGALTADAASNLKIEVKKDGNVVSSGYTTTWDDAKTVATLTFETKFLDNKFDVTISGVSNIDDTAKTASVTTTPEKITKIDFLTASDTIPLAVDNEQLLHKVRVDFKATNQYGAQSSLNASQFDIRVNGGSFATIAGEQAINISEDLDTERNDRITVTILHEESGVQANKIFTVGDEALVSKVEVGDLLNSAGTKVDQIEALGYAFLDTKAYDQYGFIVEDVDILNDGVSVNTSDSDLEVGDNDDDAYVDDVVGSDAADLKLRSTANEAKEITVTVFARGGQSVSKTISIGTSKIPATVEFGSYNYTLAEGDVQTHDEAVDSKFFVPLVVRDAKGELLDADDIVDAYDDEKFDFDSTSGLNLADDPIVRTGAHKGMIEILEADRTGNQQITVSLQDIPTQRASFSINVGEKREAQEIRFSTTPKRYMVAGSDNEVKFKIYDQQGSEMKYDDNDEYNYKVELEYKLNSTSVAGANQTFFSAKEKLSTAADDRAFKLVVPAPGQVDNSATVTEETYNTSASSFNLISSADGVNGDFWDNFFDKSFKFYSSATAPEASYTLKATLYRQEVGETNWEEVDNVSTTVEVIDPDKPENKLTYEVYLDKAVNNNTVLASDDFLDIGSIDPSGQDTTVSNATYIYNNLKKFSKEIKVRAKRTSGEEVAIKTVVTSTSSTNKNIVDIPSNASNFVVGLAQGTAAVNVVYQDAKGDRGTQQVNVTTQNQAPAVASIALKKTEKTIAAGAITGKYLWDKALAEKITVLDQYGDEIISEFAPGALNEEMNTSDQFLVKDGSIGQNHNSVLDIDFYISDIVYSGDAATADAVDIQNGKLVYTDNGGKNIVSFTVNVLAPNGVSATFDVIVTP